MILILLPALIVCLVMPVSVNAAEFTVPQAPDSAVKILPEAENASFSDNLMTMLDRSLPTLHAELRPALKTAAAVYSCTLLVAILSSFDGHFPGMLTGTVCISCLLFQQTGTMISLASETINEIGEYSKLFLPVITAASAAQGGISSAAALYAGTSVFSVFLCNVLRQLLLPTVYFYLAAAIGNSAFGEDTLKRIKEPIKKLSSWLLKSVLALYLSFISITGAVAGTADKAALKVTKAAISTVVPVIGGALAEASEALLLSTGIAKNALGMAGILVFLAIVLTPFLKIGLHYLVLKVCAALCSMLDVKRLSLLTDDFCSAMGLLLAMTGCMCALSLIGTVCFMQGIS